MNNQQRIRLLEAIIDDVEVPPSAYERARDRHRSLADWLNRDGSTIADLDPHLYPQGSFRLGTAVKPLDGRAGYDVDQVCELRGAAKATHTQAAIKALLLAEMVAYAAAQNFKNRPKSGHRCVTLEYADQAPLTFHLDELPCVPEEPAVKAALAMALSKQGLPVALARTAIAITDDRHVLFNSITSDWYSSNPQGYAEWFIASMRPAAATRIKMLMEQRLLASADEVPEFLWKTPLQRVVQLLKRHRDRHFLETPDLRPLSIVITTLAAEAYQGETDVVQALHRIVTGMSHCMAPWNAHVFNPVNRKEKFTEKWDRNPRLREAFALWLVQLRADVHQLVHGNDLASLVAISGERLGLSLGEREVARLTGLGATATTARRTGVAASSAAVLPVRAGPPPWGAEPR